jgi:ornithine cyclodeaminase/alanine dehydrogenase-like protein (mu-crystallin family)
MLRWASFSGFSELRPARWPTLLSDGRRPCCLLPGRELTKMSTITYLTERDILQAAPVSDVLDAIEASMRAYETKDFHMPPRLHVDYEGNTLLLMPCFTKACFGTKLVTLFPRNPEKGEAVLNGIMVLNDAQTGKPVALLDGPALTALRTAAVASVSIRHLAPPGARWE